MKIKRFTLKFLAFLVFVAFMSSCTTDEFEFTEDVIEIEAEMLSDTIEISKRTRVDDKDGD